MIDSVPLSTAAAPALKVRSGQPSIHIDLDLWVCMYVKVNPDIHIYIYNIYIYIYVYIYIYIHTYIYIPGGVVGFALVEAAVDIVDDPQKLFRT